MTEPVAPPPPPPPPLPRQSPSQRFLLPALLRARRDFGPIERDASARSEDGEGRSYRYASLRSCLDAVEQPLLEAELLLEQDVLSSARHGKHLLMTRVTHVVSEEWRAGYLPLPLETARDPKEAGALLTYYRRYGVMALLGLAPVDEEEEPGARRVRSTGRGELRDLGAVGVSEGPEDAGPPEDGPLDDPGPEPRDNSISADRIAVHGAETTAREALGLPPPPPPKPLSVNAMVKGILRQASHANKPEEVWLEHADFIRDLVPAVREDLVDRWRGIIFAEPPLIEGVTYPARVAPEPAKEEAGDEQA